MSGAETAQNEQVFSSNLLQGKKALVLGVANKRSIAWAIAQTLSRHGAQLAFTYQGDRIKDSVEKLVTTLPKKSPLFPCDVTKPEDIKNLYDGVRAEFGTLNYLVHCIAFAKKEDLEGRIIDTSREGYLMAHEVSAYSLLTVAKGAEPLMEKEGGSIVALTYLGSEKVVQNYNVMGMAKASLESGVRYLAHELGPKNIRVNGVSAGPVNTLAARGISGFTKMLDFHRQKAALCRNVEVEEVANTAFFLLSPLGSGITGEIIYVDAGYRIMGM
ncbi:MAG: enoyl-[acyl-carrier-protein] reductase FabI [Candidatus Omnitrophica bacterium CG11_big_fil_rev_8_21_14_0_20_45_26]|uniref:Enoyl-[acyl-carrier-protein] reductase [NADH] n=1 Tax=Candidatus Abzuiibacterium crystallinum TaxID=1974748 RepID=A0A2H0LQU3_9BACT|nr:MAG: enoyl-[acyl-carrier-protein] reductase FabI [Candidatus Omnitrophica bacterium CG11_big_fil_rev_8_21_14_0_20_45_26]PIW64250.1 MAG: enoyl-[acyl-carrier-protein] reductase FabI [Candidatus Omnitrophica bacterium CG12_big_fil_rev_8_21_14_0_65_45_16]